MKMFSRPNSIIVFKTDPYAYISTCLGHYHWCQKLLYCLCGNVEIDYVMVFELEQGDGSFNYSHIWRWHILSIPWEATSAENCGLDYVFPPDGLGSDPYILHLLYTIAAL